MIYKTCLRYLCGSTIFSKRNRRYRIRIYLINDNVKAIVSSYETLDEFKRGYESHKHVIDIQYPIIGLERVKWSPIEGMSVNIPYDDSKDRTFYKDPSPQSTHVDIGNGIFAIMFSEDGSCTATQNWRKGSH